MIVHPPPSTRVWLGGHYLDEWVYRCDFIQFFIRHVGINPCQTSGESIGNEQSPDYRQFIIKVCDFFSKSNPPANRLHHSIGQPNLDFGVCADVAIPVRDHTEAGHTVYNTINNRIVRRNVIFDDRFTVFVGNDHDLAYNLGPKVNP